MNELTTTLRLLSNCMDKMHILLSSMKTHVQDTGIREAKDAMSQLEVNACIALHRLRRALDIPYDWHERKPGLRFPDDGAYA